MMRRRRRSLAGFTLVELMISLVAGLIVSIAVIGLAKTSTRTFYEQARTATAQATTRAASERLRNDLLRAAYMSTGNIATDPKIAKASLSGTGSRYAGTTNFQGININVGVVASALLLEKNNLLAPDSITITGNMTGDDAFIGNWIDSGSAKLGTCGSGEIQMDPNGDGATYRAIASAASPDKAAKALFVPNAASFAARVQDIRGCFHYVVVCDAGYDATAKRAWVDMTSDGTNTILTPSDIGNDNCGARMGEQVTVAPVQRARWSIAANTNPVLDADTSVSPNDKKYNLIRELLDTSSAAGAVAQSQLIAEWAVDLKFGIVIHNVSANTLSVADLDSDTTGSGTISKATAIGVLTSTATGGSAAPQNIRAIRYRLSLRTELPDRQNGLATIFPAPYIVRYCTDSSVTLANCTSFARVRTIVSEVTLANQAQMFY